MTCRGRARRRRFASVQHIHAERGCLYVLLESDRHAIDRPAAKLAVRIDEVWHIGIEDVTQRIVADDGAGYAGSALRWQRRGEAWRTPRHDSCHSRCRGSLHPAARCPGPKGVCQPKLASQSSMACSRFPSGWTLIAVRQCLCRPNLSNRTRLRLFAS
jgi:hypothetical protein